LIAEEKDERYRYLLR